MLRFTKTCNYCNETYDSFLEKCPHCEEINSDPVVKKETKTAIYPWWKQLLFFFTGWLGFNIIGDALIFVLALFGLNTSANINYTAYILLITTMTFIIWTDFHPLFKSFKSWKPFVFGILGYIAILIFDTGYGIFSSTIMSLINIEKTINTNEAAVRSVVATYPLMSLLVFGVVGPICEELTYRVGCFGFLRRVNIVVAYIVSTILFALIHFQEKAITNFITNQSGENLYNLINEIINLPSYLFAGAVFAFLYHKWGFAASMTCHITNNSIQIVPSVISDLINRFNK